MTLSSLEVAQSSEALLPCPFCGGDDRLSIREPFEPSDETFVVSCDQCNAEGPYLGGSDSQQIHEAITAWNTRPATVPKDVADKLAEALRDFIGLTGNHTMTPTERVNAWAGASAFARQVIKEYQEQHNETSR